MKLAHIFAAVSVLLAVFFRFALIGYGVMALVFLGLAVLIELFALCKKRRMKKLRVLLIVLLCLGIAAVGALEIPIIRAAKTDAPEDVDYLIVLGAGVNGTVPSLSLTNRLTAALDFLESHPETVAVVSGGQGPGEDITEAECMRRWLEGRGLAPERILMEDKATSTEENLAFSLDIIRNRDDGPCRIAVCSSEYHLYRAKTMARELGVEAYGVAGKTSYPVLKLNYFLREAFAVAYMKVFG